MILQIILLILASFNILAIAIALYKRKRLISFLLSLLEIIFVGVILYI